MRNKRWLILLFLVMTSINACRPSSHGVVSTPTPDKIATGVAEARAIAATLTSEAIMSQPTATITPTRVLTVQPTNTLINPSSSPTQPKIYFSVGTDLYEMNLDGTDVKIIAQENTKSSHLFVDNFKQKIYASDWYGQILVFDIKSGKSELIEGAGWGGEGIAFDTSTSQLFLGLYYNGLFVKELRNNNTLYQLVDSVALYPLLGQRGQLQIDPTNQKIYFRTAFNGDCGECRYLYRVDFSGNNLTKIIPVNGGDALTLDLNNKKMYYSDVPGNGTIIRANLDGTKPETLFRVPEPYIFCRAIALDMTNQKIYLSLYDETTWMQRAIARSNLDGSNFEVLFQITGKTGDDVSGGIGLFIP